MGRKWFSEDKHTDERLKYLEGLGEFELEVRRLLRYHKKEISLAKKDLSGYAAEERRHLSYRLRKHDLEVNQFYVKVLRKMLPVRKNWRRRMKELLRKLTFPWRYW